MRQLIGASIVNLKRGDLNMDMESLMAQASALQDKVTAAQEKLASMHVKGIAGDGDVIIDMTGKYDLANITMRDEILSHGAAHVAKLFTAAYRDAKSKADTLIDQVMGQATAGIPMPE